MEIRIHVKCEMVPELFLVAVDKETGKIAGFLNGPATNEIRFRDEFFADEIYMNRMEKMHFRGRWLEFLAKLG